MTGIALSTRYGDVEVEANGFVDARGDAALVWQAGFACARAGRRPDLRHANADRGEYRREQGAAPRRVRRRACKRRAGDYGLLRREGLVFVIPGRGVAAMNMTHVETPLEPLEA